MTIINHISEDNLGKATNSFFNFAATRSLEVGNPFAGGGGVDGRGPEDMNQEHLESISSYHRAAQSHVFLWRERNAKCPDLYPAPLNNG